MASTIQERRLAAARRKAESTPTGRDRLRVLDDELARLGADETERLSAIDAEHCEMLAHGARILRRPPSPVGAGQAWIDGLSERVAAAVNPKLSGRRLHRATAGAWATEVMAISRNLEALFGRIHEELGAKEGEQLHSTALAERALALLYLELEHASYDPKTVNKAGRNNLADGMRRCQDALALFTRDGDSVDGRRVSAIRVAEVYAGGFMRPWRDLASMPEKNRKERAAFDVDFVEDPEGSVRRDARAWATMVRSFLAGADAAFANLDPERVLAVFTTAVKGEGGKSKGGAGRRGPLRSLAVLSRECGAFGDGARSVEHSLTAYKTALSRERARSERWLKPENRSRRK